jgi:hypothetical protein
MSPLTWQDFVLRYGFRARLDHLALILQQPAAAIEHLRRTGAVTRHKPAKAFGELFTLWKGRALRR